MKIFALSTAVLVGTVLSCWITPANGQQPRGSIYNNGSLQRSRPGVTPLPDNGFKPAPPAGATAPPPTPKKIVPPTTPPSSSFSSGTGTSLQGNPPSTSPSRSSSSDSSRGEGINVSPASVQFIDVIELPAREAGQLKNLNVKEGDAVSKGQNVARVNDVLLRKMLRQAELQQQIAQQKATNQTSVEAAVKEYSLAKVEYEKARDLASRGSRAQSEAMRAKFQKDIAALKYQQAKREIEAARGEAELEAARVDEARERIARHALESEFDGYVTELMRHAGEWVSAGDPVMKIARMDRLYVQGNISSEEYNPYEVAGQPVVVTLTLAQNQTQEFEGRISNVGLENDSSGVYYSIKAEVDNRFENGQWLLRKGSKVTMRVRRKPVTAGAATAELPARR